MTDGIGDGWEAALYVLGILVGIAPALIACTAVLWLLLAVADGLPHRIRVHRIRRQDRRFGRTPGANTPTGY
jgi:hypothetical protein